MRTLRSFAKPAVPLVVVGAAMWLATPAFAHIHTDPPAVEAGKAATVGFVVEHGCAGSATTGIDIQLPQGSKDASGVDAGGFTSSVKDDVVSFKGGPLDPDTAQTFQVRFTPPATGGDVPVKLIQTCEQGELSWIEVAKDGEPEPEHPAPMLKITEGTPSAADETPEHDHGADTAPAAADHQAGDHAAATDTTEHAADHEAAGDHDHAADPRAVPAAEVNNGSSSNTPLFIGLGAAVVVAGAGIALYLRSRGGGTPSTE